MKQHIHRSSMLTCEWFLQMGEDRCNKISARLLWLTEQYEGKEVWDLWVSCDYKICISSSGFFLLVLNIPMLRLFMFVETKGMRRKEK